MWKPVNLSIFNGLPLSIINLKKYYEKNNFKIGIGNYPCIINY